jgi:hypothetical protein
MSARPVSVAVHATTKVAPDPAFAAGVEIDLTKVFQGFGPLPAVTGVREQSGTWDRVGVSRRPVLSDGTTAFEQVTEYEPPSSFAYEVSGFTNVLGRFVAGARGDWRFTPTAEGGSAIAWTYAFRPLPRRRPIVRLVIAPLWRLYMRRGLEATVREIERAQAGSAPRSG